MSGLSARQRELVAASAAAASRARRGIEEAADRPPAPGDVFVLAATADLPVEWLLLERPDAAGPFLAVPGDAHPFLGSGDLEAETSAGQLALRCRARVRLDPEKLDLARRVATVEAGELSRVREKVREMLEDSPTEPLLEEIDASPDYRRWLREVVSPAETAAEQRSAVLPFPTPPSPLPRRRSRQTFHPLAAAAAAAFLLVTAGLGTWAYREQRRADQLAAQGREARQALAAARLGQAETSRTLAELRRRQETEVGELQRQIAELGKAGIAPPEPLLNLPVAILLPEEAMRGAAPLRVPAGSPFLVVVLRFRETRGFAGYRVTLIPEGPEGGNRPAWSSDGLERSAQGTVQLALPRRLALPGSYRLRLSGLEAGRELPLAEYALGIAP